MTHPAVGSPLPLELGACPVEIKPIRRTPDPQPIFGYLP